MKKYKSIGKIKKGKTVKILSSKNCAGRNSYHF